ncbi:hypothetical protein RB195_021557 [Necator americanus]|uniref:Uncharacterized protein n=1 Tax=Necator americanus TaxID=51031 RepID=A0ABR1EBL7_NECAM
MGFEQQTDVLLFSQRNAGRPVWSNKVNRRASSSLPRTRGIVDTIRLRGKAPPHHFNGESVGDDNAFYKDLIDPGVQDIKDKIHEQILFIHTTGDLSQEKRPRIKLRRQLKRDRENEWASREEFEKAWEARTGEVLMLY